MLKTRKVKILFVSILLLVGFLVRLYGFNNPLADWHSWRQVDTSSVSRNFVNNGFDILHPRFDDLSNVPSGMDNPQGYRLVEFPIFNLFQAGGYVLFPMLNLEQWGRLVSILASLCSALFLFLLIQKRFGFLAGISTLCFFLFLPFNIYYSRTILPDSLMVAASLAGIYFFENGINKRNLLNLSLLISLVFTASAFLLKPYALFFVLPMLYLAYEKFGLKCLKKWELWLFLVLSIIPLGLWRSWMSQYPQGIPVSDWLFNGGNIRFKGSFFYWIFAKRIGELILGSWGVALFALGFLWQQKKNDFLFILSFLLSSLIYIFVMARGNVQHDYYQILIIPSITIYLGLGSAFLLKDKDIVKRLMFLVLAAFTLFFSWYLVRDFFNINNRSIIVAGESIDRLIPKDAKIIANYNGDTTFLYHTKRKGWASFEKPMPEMIEMGASYLVLLNPTEKDLEIGREYKIVSSTNEFVLFNLLEKP